MRVALSTDAPAELTFESFFGQEYPRLVKALWLLSGDQAEAEDMAQESFARMFERWQRISRLESPAGYLYRTAMNVNRRRLRRAANAARIDLAAPATSETQTELRTDVRRALLALPNSLRSALVLAEFLEVTSEEGGRTLGIAPGSFRARLHRARREMRKQLGSDYE
jgi:RNA polymerase sigma-70 factor (ECF subfamily)